MTKVAKLGGFSLHVKKVINVQLVRAGRFPPLPSPPPELLTAVFYVSPWHVGEIENVR